MHFPLVSVLLPVHNAAETILRAIQSILNQTLTDFELVIVENGSTDDTSQIISTIQDTRIKYFQLPEADLANALNYGLMQCTAPYIARMDADDVSMPERLAIQSQYLMDHPDIGLVSSWVQYCGNASQSEGYVAYVDWANSIQNTQEIYLSRFQESALPHPSVMFRKSLIDQFGDYQADAPEDFELWNRWLSEGVKMAKIDKTLLDWYDPPHRLSRTHDNYGSEAFQVVKARYFKKWWDDQFPNNKPDIYIFGYSKVVKLKIRPLQSLGFETMAFLDIKDTASPHTIYYQELEQISNKFVLSYVSDRKGKQEVKTYLTSIGMQEGVDFYMMA